MENDILDSLVDLCYEGPLTDEVAFSKALDGGPKSLEYTKLVHILAEELKTLCGLEETVNLISSVDESSSFVLELSSFLKELKCPYKCLVTGYMSSRLQSKEDRILLLDYLISELMAARMVQVDNPKEKQGSGMEIVMQESPTAKDLKEILIALKFNKPPPNITPEMLFAKLESKLKDTIAKEGQQLVGKPLYNKAMTEKDWKLLEDSYTDMYEDYRLRRETLLTRLECTIQSFEWSDRLKSKKDVIQSVYRPQREALKMKPNVKLSDFLAARTSLLLVEKTSSANVRKNTQSDVNKVLIGEVPDRGGRPNEAQPPPPEMPSWQQRTTARGRGGPGGGGRGEGRGGGRGDGGRGGGGRGGDRGGRGGRVQGGYSQATGQEQPRYVGFSDLPQYSGSEEPFGIANVPTNAPNLHQAALTAPSVEMAASVTPSMSADVPFETWSDDTEMTTLETVVSKPTWSLVAPKPKRIKKKRDQRQERNVVERPPEVVKLAPVDSTTGQAIAKPGTSKNATGQAEQSIVTPGTSKNEAIATPGTSKNDHIRRSKPRGKRAGKLAKQRKPTQPTKRSHPEDIPTLPTDHKRARMESQPDAFKSNELCVAVMTERYDLTSEQANAIKSCLEKKLLADVFNPATTEHMANVGFRGKAHHSEGVLKMWCEDKIALQWLCHAVENIPSPIPGSKLVVRPQGDIQRRILCGLLVPELELDINIIRRTLILQNIKTVNIGSWSLVRAEKQVHTETPGIYLLLRIPVSEVEKLIKQDRRLKWLFGNIYVRILEEPKTSAKCTTTVKPEPAV